MNIENAKYREYLYRPDPTLSLNGCCQSYPLDRDYWNNQLLSRNFLIDYGKTEHLKYPISDGLCMKPYEDRDQNRGQDLNNCQKLPWTIERQGLNNVTCQAELLDNQYKYWLHQDSSNLCPSQGMPLIPEKISDSLGQPLCRDSPIDLNNSLEIVEKNRLKNQCCPTKINSYNRVDNNKDSNNGRSNSIYQYKNYSSNNHRNINVESALFGIDFINTEDCVQNKICSDPLQSKKSNLYQDFFQDSNCIFPNFTPKFWDNLTKAKSGSQLITVAGASKDFC